MRAEPTGAVGMLIGQLREKHEAAIAAERAVRLRVGVLALSAGLLAGLGLGALAAAEVLPVERHGAGQCEEVGP